MLGNKLLSSITIIEAVAPDRPDALTLAAGMCGRIAADLGARVIRLVNTENSVRDAAVEQFLHRGKDYKRTRIVNHVSALRHLAHEADCVIADQAVHAELSSLGSAAIPVCLTMSADAPAGGSEFTLEARSGLLDLVGDPERQPLRLGGHQIAYSAGLAAFLGMMNSLVGRGAGINPNTLNVNLLDVAVWLNWKTLGLAANNATVPSRLGFAGEWPVVACRDGYFALVYRAEDWSRLKAVAADVRLDDPCFDTAAGREEHRLRLNSILQECFIGYTRAELRQIAIRNRLPFGPIWKPEELLNDPHMIDRKFFRRISAEDEGRAVPILPVRWNGQAFPPETAQ